MRFISASARSSVTPGMYSVPASGTFAIAAASIVVTIPVVVLVLLFQRKIVAGLTSGAVKG